jgi:nitroreductase
LIAIGARPLGPFVTADCWLAAENLMLAACALGLGTCCIGSAVPALNGPETKSELGIPSDAEIVAPIIVGVPREAAAEVSRHNPTVVSWTRSE